MAITKTDCLILLKGLQNKGIDTKDAMVKVVKAADPPFEVIKFINDNRPFEVSNFYDRLKKNNNLRKSTLYKNIVRSDEDEPKNVLTTLSSLNLQILLFAEKCENPTMFLQNARFDEINAVLYNYSKTFDIIPCIELLKAVKADLKAFESMKN